MPPLTNPFFLFLFFYLTFFLTFIRPNGGHDQEGTALPYVARTTKQTTIKTSSLDGISSSRSNSSNSIFNQESSSTSQSNPNSNSNSRGYNMEDNTVRTGRKHETDVYGLDNEFLKKICSWRPKVFGIPRTDGQTTPEIVSSISSQKSNSQYELSQISGDGNNGLNSSKLPISTAGIPTFEQFRKVTETLWEKAQDFLPSRPGGNMDEKENRYRSRKENKNENGNGNEIINIRKERRNNDLEQKKSTVETREKNKTYVIASRNTNQSNNVVIHSNNDNNINFSDDNNSSSRSSSNHGDKKKKINQQNSVNYDVDQSIKGPYSRTYLSSQNLDPSCLLDSRNELEHNRNSYLFPDRVETEIENESESESESEDVRNKERLENEEMIEKQRFKSSRERGSSNPIFPNTNPNLNSVSQLSYQKDLEVKIKTESFENEDNTTINENNNNDDYNNDNNNNNNNNNIINNNNNDHNLNYFRPMMISSDDCIVNNISLNYNNKKYLINHINSS